MDVTETLSVYLNSQHLLDKNKLSEAYSANNLTTGILLIYFSTTKTKEISSYAVSDAQIFGFRK